MVWRRLRVPGNTTLARLHECIQIINGWDDYYLHFFRIHGKDFGTQNSGGFAHAYGAKSITFDDLEFDAGDKFTYEYNFFNHYLYDIRIERVQISRQPKEFIRCISGSGMPDATKYDAMDIQLEFMRKIVDKKGKLTVNDITEFQEDLDQVKFNRRKVNAEITTITTE